MATTASDPLWPATPTPAYPVNLVPALRLHHLVAMGAEPDPAAAFAFGGAAALPHAPQGSPERPAARAQRPRVALEPHHVDVHHGKRRSPLASHIVNAGGGADADDHPGDDADDHAGAGAPSSAA